jgi:hypothetical protein
MRVGGVEWLAMISEAQIREHVANYLAGKESLDSFEDWLVEHSWNMHLDSSESVQDLVNEVEIRLSEYSSGHLSDRALRRELYQILNNNSVVIDLETTTRTRLRTSSFPTTHFPLAGRPPLEVSV